MRTPALSLTYALTYSLTYSLSYLPPYLPPYLPTSSLTFFALAYIAYIREGYGATTNGVTTFANASTCTVNYSPTSNPSPNPNPSNCTLTLSLTTTLTLTRSTTSPTTRRSSSTYICPTSARPGTGGSCKDRVGISDQRAVAVARRDVVGTGHGTGGARWGGSGSRRGGAWSET